MNSILLICLVTLWSVTLAYQVNERELLPPKLPLQPGDLLRSLDELTSEAQVIYSPIQDGSTNSANRRVYQADGPNENADPDTEFDYDKAYEEFVSKYFAQGEDDLESEDEDEKSADSDDAVAYDTQNDEDQADQPKSNKKVKSKKCERVEIDNQNCVVCEDPKTNEKSKSCSYSSESEPQSYAFSRERSTKRSNDDDDDDGDSTEDGKSLKRDTASRNTNIQPRRTSIKPFVPPAAVANNGGTSKCSRKKEDGMICYYCGNAKENTRECMSVKNYPKKRRLDESTKKDGTTKKIYKRMITYSYKSDEEPTVDENIYAGLRGY